MLIDALWTLSYAVARTYTHRHIHVDTYTHSHVYTKTEKHIHTIHTCIHPHMVIFHTRTKTHR